MYKGPAPAHFHGPQGRHMAGLCEAGHSVPGTLVPKDMARPVRLIWIGSFFNLSCMLDRSMLLVVVLPL